MEVELTSSLFSYGDESENIIYDNEGTKTLIGEDFGDLETGQESPVKWFYFRHNGEEPIYNVGIFIRAVGTEWGGYVPSYPDSKLPFNPNIFRSGGLTESGSPTSSTVDYEFMRQCALSNPEMGVRLHQDRNDEFIKTPGLGYDNKGLSFSPISLKRETLDFSKSSDPQLDGLIYPEPLDSSKIAQAGDEAKIGISIKIPEDTIGAGHVQFAIAIKYRYTS